MAFLTMLSEMEKAIRRRLAAQKVAHFPVVEYCLEVLSCDGPDLGREALELHEALEKLSQRMVNEEPRRTTPGTEQR